MTRPALFLAALITLTASACTPAMQDAWRAMSPAERDAYVRYVDGGSVDCYQAVRPLVTRRRVGRHELAPPHPRHLPIRGGRR